jgi:hypothetical protein
MNRRYYDRFRGRVTAYPRWLRIAIGVALLAGGVLGFLPVLGFWMFPLGLLVLSYDLPAVRRWRRRLEVAWLRRRRRKTEQNGREE